MKKTIAKFDKVMEKHKNSIMAYLGLSALILGFFFFYTAHHNLDLLSNYALLTSDFNREYNCDNNFIDIRDITDCGFTSCDDYATIYMSSQKLMLAFVLLFMFVCYNMVVANWKFR